MAEELEYFSSTFSAFKSDTSHAIRLSKAFGGLRADLASGWASWIFVRMCAAGNSAIGLLSDVDLKRLTGPIDHGSILSICRNIIEGQIMLNYIAHREMTFGDFLLKRMIFDIHDCSSRLRLFRGLGQAEEVKVQEEALCELQSKIAEHVWFDEMPDEKKKQILEGKVIYLNGFRTAAEEAGWDSGKFDALYSYLSAQIHSSPMSFYRMDRHNVNYRNIAPYQLGIVAFALELASQSMQSATKRMEELFPDQAAEVRSAAARSEKSILTKFKRAWATVTSKPVGPDG